MKQFTDVNCQYGAPMGRHEYGLPQNCEARTVRAFRVNLHGDYDDGGAYWCCGQALYCVTNGDDYCRFTRAPSRAAAILALDLEGWQLIRK